MSCHAVDTGEGVASGLRLVLRDMVLPHLLMLLLLRLRRHELLQLLYHHHRRGRGVKADAQAVPRAAQVLGHL